MTRTYRAYTATLLGDYLDIKVRQTTRADAYASDRYDASQKLGEEVRVSGGAGLLYDSLRRRTGANALRIVRAISQTSSKQIISKLRSWQRRARSTSANCRLKRLLTAAIEQTSLGL
jgi:hypothetical protein